MSAVTREASVAPSRTKEKGAMGPVKKHDGELTMPMLVQLLTLISLLGTLATGLIYVARRDAKFEPIEQNIRAIEQRLTNIEQKLDSLIERTTQNTSELKWLGMRVDALERRVNGTNGESNRPR